MNRTALAERVVVRREIAAPPETIFDAWVDPKALAAWMKPDRASRSTATVDARVGGRFEIVMHMPGGPVAHRGVYEAIDRPRRLVFTWNSPYAGEIDSRVTVDFHPRPGGTEVVVTHVGLPDAESARMHREGWSELLPNLAKLASR